jgi:hypothetical protein
MLAQSLALTPAAAATATAVEAPEEGLNRKLLASRELKFLPLLIKGAIFIGACGPFVVLLVSQLGITRPSSCMPGSAVHFDGHSASGWVSCASRYMLYANLLTACA